MEQVFNTYLESIGITGALANKVEEIYKFYNQYLGHQIDDLFVSEYINKEGSRVYENLWFFNSNFVFEAKLFNTQEDFDSTIIKKSIDYYTIKKIDFDIISNTINDNSRMNVEFRFKNSSVSGDMKSSRENCKQLSLIVKKYIQPNQERL